MSPLLLFPRVITLAQSAATETQSFHAIELDLPESTPAILLLVAGIAVVLGLAVRTSLRDSRFLSRSWRTILLVPRLLVFVLLLAIVLNPRERTQLSRIEKSQVGILLDTSLSMAYPAREVLEKVTAVDVTTPGVESVSSPPVTTSASDGSTEASALSRAQAVTQQLMDSQLLGRLSQTHAVSLYTFDSAMSGPAAIVTGDQIRFMESLPVSGEPASGSETAKSDVPPNGAAAAGNPATRLSLDPDSQRAGTDELVLKLTEPEALSRLQALLQPRGTETRLGESLHQLIGQMSGRTLSGLVVISDGRLNAGLDAEAARVRAERSGTRIIAAGVGSRRPQMNLWIAAMQSPTDVHKGDPFDLNVVVQSSGAEGRAAIVRLYLQSAGSDGKDRKQVGEQSVTLAGDGLPNSVRFTHQSTVPGKYEYIAAVEIAPAEPALAAVEMTTEDNERRREIEVTDRRIRVLLISSGPMRDYQFVRNTLFRHSGIESDVWLQSVADENVEFVTQEARRTLTRFPATEAELFEYDVVVAFDPDWDRLSADERQYLNRWVAEHSGGLIVIAGEIFTPRLAQEAETRREISVLYPVLLNRMLPELRISQRADQPWPVKLTADGRAAEFLKIADATGNASTDLWDTFRGIFRSYPVRGLRDGAVVLLEYGNPRARTELGQPPFLASQFYGTGRTVFIGSAETWRLREISPQGHQRFWTSLIREVGQGRRTRGTARGLLLLDRTESVPGQAVNIRAQLYDSRLQPLQTESVAVSIVDSEGRPQSVPDRLLPDNRRAGQFVSNFRPTRPGLYRVSVPVPESSDVLQATLDVVLPNLESQNATQNVELLTSLASNTDSRFLDVFELSQQLPALLPDRSEPVIIDEQLRTLWDRSWLMYALIGLLSLEWALRRVVRLS